NLSVCQSDHLDGNAIAGDQVADLCRQVVNRLFRANGAPGAMPPRGNARNDLGPVGQIVEGHAQLSLLRSASDHRRFLNGWPSRPEMRPESVVSADAPGCQKWYCRLLSRTKLMALRGDTNMKSKVLLILSAGLLVGAGAAKDEGAVKEIQQAMQSLNDA